MNLKSLMTNNSNKRKEEVAANVAKWGRVGLLEGLDETQANNVAQLLENQAHQLLREANMNSTQAGSEEWNGIALPLVRRIFSSISAKDFLSTQSMSMPTGLVFWYDHKYASGQPGFTTGSQQGSQEDSLYGVTDARRGAEVATGGLYGPGRFGYTLNDVSANTVAATITAVTPATAPADLNFDSERIAVLTDAIAAGRVVKFTTPVSALTSPDLHGVRGFTVTDTAGTQIKAHLAGYTRTNADRTNIHWIALLEDSQTAITFAAAAAVIVSYHKETTDITRGDFEANLPANAPLDIPTLDLSLKSESISAVTRKLKAVWTTEFEQDINAYHSIDVEAEMTALLGDYITKEIDLELIDMLYNNAQSTGHWSARLGFAYDKASNSFVQTPSNVAAYTQGSWFQTLGTTIQKMSNEIGRLTMSDGANFMVVSPTIATILESIPGYAASTDGTKGKFGMGPSAVGTISNRWDVYKVPYMTENSILMGYRGGSYLECGAVYSPYIPLMTTPTILDPINFVPRKAISTRYAKKMLRPEFYGKIFIEGVNTI